jgi:hypothetical protein
MPRPKGRDSAKEKHWRRMLSLWQRSGLTGRDFCGENGLSEPSFYGWKREIQRRDREAAARAKRAGAKLAAFVEVTVDGDPATGSALEVVVAKDRVVRVQPGFDAATLRELVRVLEEPGC